MYAHEFVYKHESEPPPTGTISSNDFPLNKMYSMEQNNRRRFYTIKFKLQVVEYAKEHGNMAAEGRFGSPPTEKMVRACFG